MKPFSALSMPKSCLQKPLACAVHSLAVAALCATPALAQQGSGNKQLYLEEVITTATTQSTLLSETGISLSVMKAETLEEMAVNNFSDFTRTIPGVNFAEGDAPGEQTIVIRGVNFPSNRFQQSTVAIYVDELALTQNGRNPDVDLIDMERVEVLRGPQGTLYGSSSMGGTLRYITNKPETDEFYGAVELGLESTDSNDIGYRANGFVNIPISDNMAFRATGYMKDLDGWIDSIGWAGSSSGDGNEIIDGSLAEEGVNEEETTGGRLALRWRPTDELTVDLMWLNHDTEVTGLLSENPFWGDKKQQRRFPEIYSDTLNTYNLTLAYDIDNGTFMWNSMHMEREYRRVSDPSRVRIGLAWWFGDFTDAFDYGIDAFVDGNRNFAGHAVVDRPIDYELDTHEFRFSSTFDGRFNFVAGAYYSEANNNWKQQETYPGLTESYSGLIPFAYPNFYLATSYEDAATTQNFIVEADGYSGQDNDGDGVVDVFHYEPELYGFLPSDVGFLEDRDENIEQLSVYGNFTFEVTESLYVTAGIRWFDISIDNDIRLGGQIAGTDALLAADELLETPAGERRDELVQSIIDDAAINYVSDTKRLQEEDGTQLLFGFTYDIPAELHEDAMVYYTFAEGYRVGGVNRAIPRRDGSVIPQFFDSDSLESHEIGWKTQWLDNRLEWNGALFFIDWKDIQIAQTDDVTQFDYTENAGKAEIEGLETEMRYLVSEHWDVSAGLTHMDHEITEGEDKGSELPDVSNDAYYFAVRFETDIGGNMFYTRADWTYTGGYQTDPNPSRPVIESYDTLNISAGLESDTWAISAYFRNVFDDDSPTGKERPGNSADLGRFTRIKPRTIGGSVKWMF